MLGEHHAADHFIKWLSRGFSGCHFAAHLAGENRKPRSQDRILCATFLDELTSDALPDIERIIDMSAAEGQIALFLFPRLRAADDVVGLLSLLVQHERWRCSAVDWGASKRDGYTLFGLDWITREGAKSSAMGFAPLGSMSVTRRAPYVAIALWAGGHENKHKPSTRNVVGFVDFPVSGGKKEHDRLWEKSRADVQTLLSDPAEDAALLRRVAFCVPDSAAVLAAASGGFLRGTSASPA
jgi:hypothetical protein